MRMLLTAALVAAALPMAADTTATGTAVATVVPAPATVTHVDGKTLNFGTITSSALAQNIDVPPAKGDSFTFTKDHNETLQISFAPSTDVINTGDATQVCKLINLNASLPLFTGSDSTAGGFMVGGTLQVPSWIKKGDYSGTYTVTVGYK